TSARKQTTVNGLHRSSALNGRRHPSFAESAASSSFLRVPPRWRHSPSQLAASRQNRHVASHALSANTTRGPKHCLPQSTIAMVDEGNRRISRQGRSPPAKGRDEWW